jgi:hypothetical protein
MVEETTPVVLQEKAKESKSKKVPSPVSAKKASPTPVPFVKKRDAKASEKAQVVVSKSPAAPKFVKRENKLGLKKQSSSIFGLFGDENPFAKKPSKLNKTLIATPSKFEIRSATKPARAGRKASPAKKAMGIRGKLNKAADKKKAPVAAKVSDKSKKIDKNKLK